jgi:hypothetical protein
MLPVDILPLAVHSSAITGNAMWTSMWFVHGLRFGPHRARWCHIARVVSCVQLGCRVAAGEPLRAMPRHVL